MVSFHVTLIRDECYLRVDDQHLALLTVRPRGAVHEHRGSTRNRHVERSNHRLTVLKRNVSAVNGGRHRILQRLACCTLRALRDRVVAVAELELYDIADLRRDQVRYESILRSADHYRDELIALGSSRSNRCRLSSDCVKLSALVLRITFQFSYFGRVGEEHLPLQFHQAGRDLSCSAAAASR